MAVLPHSKKKNSIIIIEWYYCINYYVLTIISSLPLLFNIIIAIIIAILFIISLILSETCNKINEYQKIKSLRFIYKKKSVLPEKNVYSLVIGNEEYLIILSNRDVKKLKRLGFSL